MHIKNNFHHTLYASYLGYVTQAIVNNLAPLLFLTFQKTYQVSLEQISLLITLNFGVQLLVDLLAAKFVDRIGYRVCIVAAHVLSAAGLVGLSTLPGIFPEPFWGLIAAVMIYAIGGGLIEVLVSPIVEACPTDEKSSAMSLLHSFYCWGSVLVIALSTLFFQVSGVQNWRILACLWAIVPLLNAFYFSRVPIRHPAEGHQGMSIRRLCSMKIFWLFVLLMLCAGAAEQSMSQWASSFAESGLGVSKTVGDLAGPCLFAVLMGLSRVFYAKFSEKVDLQKFILYSGFLCILGYLLASFAPYPALSLAGCAICGLSVGILWPGVFSISSARCPTGGTALFALLALAGDLGCSTGPAMVGILSQAGGGNLKFGLVFAIVFPVVLILGMLALRKSSRKAAQSEI